MISCKPELVEQEEPLVIESMPEFVREPYSSLKEPLTLPKFSSKNDLNKTRAASATVDKVDKTAELEALWPGVNNDFLPHHINKSSPSFFLSIGFLAGAIISLAGVGIYSLLSHHNPSIQTTYKKVVVTRVSPGLVNSTIAQVTTRNLSTGTAQVVVPIFPVYEVKSGDTLAAIALTAYKRVSPRLLDEICRANNLHSADVLNLGEKLTMPEYHMQVAPPGQVQ